MSDLYNRVARRWMPVAISRFDYDKESFDVYDEDSDVAVETFRARRSLGAQPGGVYFVQAVNGGPIKIGVSIKIESRLRDLQACCPVVLVLLGSFIGTRDDEQRLHQELSRHRLHGEWFVDCRDVRRVIDRECNRLR